ncbi:MAG: zinc-binding dehydrogenase [Phycisphaerae bacterium]|jgi:threonine dehydrogenase-like Zn-dependent dehydrogenase|nr:zinc-binding dehydrogenase [Phycisphaerae bacterium]
MNKFENYRNQKEFQIPKTMKAVTLNGVGFENLKVSEVPVPQPGPNQLLCRVDAAGVCTSILKIISQGSKHTYINGWDLEKFPVILGDEGSVTVAAVGDNLKNQYKPGQRFAVQPAVDVAPICHRERYANNAAGMSKCAVGYTLGGNLAEYILIQEEVLQGQCLLPLPDDSMSYFGVSMAEPISCIYSAQDRQYHIFKDGPFSPRVPKLGLLPGGTAVVIGAGAMGRIHFEMAMRYRPKNLIISDLVQERMDHALKTNAEKAKKLGINLFAINGKDLNEELMKITNGAGADDIILAVGVQPVQQNALGLLGKGGVANFFGGLPKGKNMLQIDAIAIHYNEIKVAGSSGGDPYDMKSTLDAIYNKDVDPGNYVAGVGSLKHAPQVLKMIEETKVDGKVILYPGTDIDDLRFVDHWDQTKEIEFLENNLR